MILKLYMQLWELKLYEVYINDDPELTFTYFTARSNLAAYGLGWGKIVVVIKLEKLEANVGINIIFIFK